MTRAIYIFTYIYIYIYIHIHTPFCLHFLKGTVVAVNIFYLELQTQLDLRGELPLNPGILYTESRNDCSLAAIFITENLFREIDNRWG